MVEGERSSQPFACQAEIASFIVVDAFHFNPLSTIGSGSASYQSSEFPLGLALRSAKAEVSVLYFSGAVTAQIDPQLPSVWAGYEPHASGHLILQLQSLVGFSVGLSIAPKTEIASDLVGRRGLDPRTLGLKVPCSTR